MALCRPGKLDIGESLSVPLDTVGGVGELTVTGRAIVLFVRIPGDASRMAL